jgi:hypothetical protein
VQGLYGVTPHRGVCVQASEVDYPEMLLFCWSIRLCLVWKRKKKQWTLEEFAQNPKLLHTRCPYSGRTLPMEHELMHDLNALLELGTDPTARDWQVRLNLVKVYHRPAADVTLWQGGLCYWALKTDMEHIRKDLLVRGIELGPISYRRRPSTSCRLDFAASLGYVPTIAGLQLFQHEGQDDDKVNVLQSYLW